MKKSNLQRLWKKMDFPGRCPQPDPNKVLRRVDAALDSRPRRRLPRPVRFAAILTAALLLLTSIAAASGQFDLPEWNVLSTNFYWGGNEEYAASLVNAQLYSVSDDNYTLSVTSSIATERTVYFTIVVEGKTEEARQFLQSREFIDYGFFAPLYHDGEDVPGLIYKISWLAGPTGGWSIGYNEETGCAEIDVKLKMGIGVNRHISIRLNQMDDGLWLTFPVKPVKDVKIKIGAEGQGRGTFEHAAGGPVKLETVTLSPLDAAMEYSTPCDNEGAPVLFFLWKDGTVSTWGELHMNDMHSGSGSVKDDWWHHKNSWEFGGVQDISQMEAVIFEGTAYPLDGGEPYETDVSELPVPFNLPRGEKLPGAQYASLPMFALCDALGIPYSWDGETAVMTYRGVTMTFSLDSSLIRLGGAPSETAEMHAAPVYQDGELWADTFGCLGVWSVSVSQTYANSWLELKDETGESLKGDWLVIP